MLEWNAAITKDRFLKNRINDTAFILVVLGVELGVTLLNIFYLFL